MPCESLSGLVGRLERPLRVLISAYSCDPYRGSEPAVGWNWVCRVARFHEVWVITQLKNRLPIEESPATQLMPNVHWVYFDPPGWSPFKSTRRGSIYPYHRYYLWQVRAYFVAKKLHGEVGFDLIHHVTFVNYWMPSFLAMLPSMASATNL